MRDRKDYKIMHLGKLQNYEAVVLTLIFIRKTVETPRVLELIYVQIKLSCSLKIFHMQLRLVKTLGDFFFLIYPST